MVGCAFTYVPNVQKGLQAAAHIVSILERTPQIKDYLDVNQPEVVKYLICPFSLISDNTVS